jgi:hypothetical protein
MLSAVFANLNESSGQFIPIPPPGPNAPDSGQSQIKGDVATAPNIEFLTQSLKQGKNVFTVKVIGGASIDLVQIKQASNGKIIAAKMEPEGKNTYKFLVDAQSPSKVIVIRAFDINGRYAEAVKIYNVQQSSDLLAPLKNFFGGIF